MREAVKQVTSEIISQPKTVAFVATLMQWAAVYVDYIAPIIASLSSILAFVILTMSLVYSRKRNKKIDQDFELDRLRIEKEKREIDNLR